MSMIFHAETLDIFRDRADTRDMTNTQLPEHLQKAWGGSTIDPRDKPHYCDRQSHKTPMIPWHNGFPKCLSCGKTRNADGTRVTQ